MSNSFGKRFETLVRPHFDALYRTAFRLTRRRQDAEDLVQDVCLRAYTHLRELEAAEHTKAWLMRVQYRLFIDGTRRRRRAPLQPLPDVVEPFDGFAADAPGPDEWIDGERLQSFIQQAWTALETDQRALLALHIEGHTLAELEQITGVSKNALSARLHRARVRLAKLLEHELGGPIQLKHMES